MIRAGSGPKIITEKVFRQLASRANCLLYIYDPTAKRFNYLSDYAPVLLGTIFSRIEQDPAVLWDSILAEDREYICSELKLLGKKECLTADFRLHLPDQPVKWIHTKAFRLEEDPLLQGCIAGFAEDITQRKETELFLANTHAQKDVALQILGHDIRAPIGTISAASSLLERSVGTEDLKNLEPLFRIISDTCRNALNLINEVLESVYWDAQHTVKKKSRVDLVELVESQLYAYRLLHQDQKEFKLCASADHIFVVSDQVRLQLILENLLSNAFKFTKRNGTIIVGIQEQRQAVLVTVKDDGIGIPEGLKSKIFQKFTAARREGLQGEKPTGLGLHIVKTMVEQLSGRIWFESREGEGTTFFVELPKKG
ncbi:sensor histidine kinase KdpD [Cesiribacter sp. SM1]|uniref:sensor histidine kinase n=1 Tax=Cesiribacter sp. SM1 TaxID=2861196 RepID=UPI001CD49CAB|nr:HAMP domain-containing sensor histidine kinase [Cesiribacter sp. SM1]